MRLGFITDAHLSFHRYNKVNEKGVNQREADFYSAYISGIENLVNANVEAIVDLGDIADVPHPKKRAVNVLIETINASGLPYYAIDGNHTKVRVSGDIHLFQLLEAYCPRFYGHRETYWVGPLGAVLVPYGTSGEILRALGVAEAERPDFIAGHFACDDVLPDGHDIKAGDLPKGIPVFLGHFHGRSHPQLPAPSGLMVAGASPVYVGATERGKWGEWQNPTGVAVYDTDTKVLKFIEHEARAWIDLEADPTTYLDVFQGGTRGRDDAPIVRLTVAATKEEYNALDFQQLDRLAEGRVLNLSVRRLSTESDGERREPSDPVAFDLRRDWHDQVAGASLSRGTKREQVEQAGADALVAAGIAA